MTKSVLLWLDLPGVTVVDNKIDIDISAAISYSKGYDIWLHSVYKKVKLPDNWWM